MNAADALKLEIEHTPEPLLREVYDFLVFLKSRTQTDDARRTSSQACVSVEVPEFLARQQAVFGGRMLKDSQEVLDELREDRI